MNTPAKSKSKQPSYDAYLFDLDGTLVNSQADILNALNLALQDMSLPTIPHSKIDKTHMSFSSIALINEAKVLLGIDLNEAESQHLRELLLNHYEKSMGNHTGGLYAGAHSLLKALHDAEIPLGIVTNKLTRHVTPLLPALGIQNFFKVIVCGDTLAKAKPDPMTINYACDILEVSPQKNNIILVGDTITDLECAHNASVDMAFVTYGYGTISQHIDLQPQHRVDALDEIYALTPATKNH